MAKNDKGFGNVPVADTKRTPGSSGFKPVHRYPTPSRVNVSAPTSHPALSLPTMTASAAQTALDKVEGQKNTLAVRKAQYELVGQYWQTATAGKQADQAQLQFNQAIVGVAIEGQKLAAKEYDLNAAQTQVQLSATKAGTLNDKLIVDQLKRQLNQSKAILELQTMEISIKQANGQLGIQQSSLERLQGIKANLKPTQFKQTVEIKSQSYES